MIGAYFVESDKDKPDTGVGEMTGTDNPQEDQTKMTPFKINLKDERFVSMSVYYTHVPLSLALYSKGHGVFVYGCVCAPVWGI